MKNVHNSKGRDDAVNELCKRYEQRRMDFSEGSDFAEQKSREIASRVSVQKMKREYVPDTSVGIDTNLVLQSIDRARYENKNMKTEKNNLKDQNSHKNRNISLKIKESAKVAAKTWVPLEERHSEMIVEGKKTKIPMNIILSIIIITISLFLIVGSMVLLGSALSEQNDLKSQIESLDFEIAELRSDLNRKNENADIEFFAENVFGMIKQDHINAEYIKSNKTDGISKQEDDKVSFATLIDWIFQQFK